MTKRIVLGVTGATGSIYALRLLEKIRLFKDVESHLIVSPAGLITIKHELGMDRKEFIAHADYTHGYRDVSDMLASGTVSTLGMVVLPCTMHTLAACALGLSENLISRAADVHLKERRRLILAIRETPLNLAHLKNMTAVTEMGGVIFPPLPAFYQKPESIDDIVNNTVDRILALLGFELPEDATWKGL
ncbi:UbiX family flavin prenyltransferase [Taylorella equigenitalis]|uniref:Flavin prenyltransferase UbiX n=1 Tax=Taylorella equigenitalis 14/56 TaxID=1091497 RepID=I7JKP9_9BURK|nr:UbiX family flavin prenyltransferase [Taylorella equigenitalis]ASY37347.1 3-octaprenyl-4-hydroxybenzoate carboxy-lyase [Taylorella equigenitalis]ASY41771.1 3-octaprenyl-4-hydroxybenzoate carboxy-lyase [Taylorella equigenitalis]KGK33575.1 3-octaprenyl-4-hydroxybenzoate carboxy-lyase [Taylorella equigenitalis]RBA27280.1 UbiX family flavin prenyltransferase [Taylorella equigenitalis]WDU46635.1 UbiX family flavin prenyltransferase [Taylorella equigenitalis]